MKTTTEAQTYEQAVEKVVKWWVQKSFKTPLNQNNGDDSAQGGMAFMLMNMVAQRAQTEVTDEKIQMFEKELTNQLMAAQPTTGQRGLFVDYDPDASLAKACEVAGIDTSCLPIKSGTIIRQDNTAFARYQYGGSFQPL